LGREDVGIWRELRCGVGNQVSLVLPFSWSRSLSLKFGILMMFWRVSCNFRSFCAKSGDGTSEVAGVLALSSLQGGVSLCRK